MILMMKNMAMMNITTTKMNTTITIHPGSEDSTGHITALDFTIRFM